MVCRAELAELQVPVLGRAGLDRWCRAGWACRTFTGKGVYFLEPAKSEQNRLTRKEGVKQPAAHNGGEFRLPEESRKSNGGLVNWRRLYLATSNTANNLIITLRNNR
jgi:hypothetical protein